MTNPHRRRLGKLPARTDARTIQLRQHITPALPPPPAAIHWEKPITNWGTMGNDEYGNCVIATAGHEILSWRANELADTKRITDSAVIALSRQMGALDGYNILDRLNYWRQHGMWAHGLWLFAQIAPDNSTLIKSAISIFGAADIGLQLPRAWQNAQVWDTGHGFEYEPGGWGGHSVPIVGYDAELLYIVTWGEIQPITWRAIPVYCDEAYADISADWLAKNGTTPSGFNLDTLKAALQEITA
jgi:hypothetical protein